EAEAFAAGHGIGIQEVERLLPVVRHRQVISDVRAAKGPLRHHDVVLAVLHQQQVGYVDAGRAACRLLAAAHLLTSPTRFAHFARAVPPTAGEPRLYPALAGLKALSSLLGA